MLLKRQHDALKSITSTSPWRFDCLSIEYGDTEDNPDIEKFMGYFEFRSVYKWHGQTFGLLLRNNLRTCDNKGATELSWSFPLYQMLKGYVQYLHGYGESFIDYNENDNTIGFGLQLAGWLWFLFQ